MTLDEALDRIHELEEQVRRLEDALAPPGIADLLPVKWKLTPLQRRIMAVFVRYDGVLPSARFHGLMCKTGNASEFPDFHNNFSVQICKMRPKLARYGYEIKTLWRHGYYIPKEQREAIKSGVVRYGANTGNGFDAGGPIS